MEPPVQGSGDQRNLPSVTLADAPIVSPASTHLRSAAPAVSVGSAPSQVTSAVGP